MPCVWPFAWQSAHSAGGFCASRPLCAEPCGVWQIAQFSSTGGCVWIHGPRLSAWQVRHRSADGLAPQARLLQRTVRLVAVLAGDLAFDDRVVRGLDDFAAHVAVALDAPLVDELAHGRRVRRGRELRTPDLLVVARRLRAVELVAVHARHVDLAVLGDRPVLERPLAAVAVEAHRRLFRRGGGLGRQRALGLVLGGVLQVERRVTVAGLACASVRVVLRAVRGQQDGGVGLLVALDAHRHGQLGILPLREGGRREGRCDGHYQPSCRPLGF